MTYIEQFKAARRVSVPIVIIRTPDYAETMREIVAACGANGPMMAWDLNQGVNGINPAGKKAAALVNAPADPSETPQPPALTTGNPQEALTRALALAPGGTSDSGGSVLFLQNAHILLEQREEANRLSMIQSIANLRDPFKSTNRMVVLLVPDIVVPRELANDVVILDVPLPDETRLTGLISDLVKSAGVDAIDDAGIKRGVDAITGLSAFSAEQVTAMAMRKSGLNYEAMWERKKTIIRQVGGLNVPNGVSSFDSIGGLRSIIDYGKDILAGKHCPKLVVLIDEVEKQMSGLGDSNGINQDCFSQILQAMQDNEWDGLLLPGFPGTGKTEFAKALGAEAGGLFLSLDLGGLKNSLVGESEKMVRAAMQILLAMGGNRVLFVATCNSMAELKPELIRRLSYGTYFFDLPSKEAQAPIWDLYRKKYGISDAKLPPCGNWTGAEIKKVCKLADEFNKPLIEVAARITPVFKAMGEKAAALQKQAADGGWLSADTGLPYTNDRTTMTKAMKDFISGKPSTNKN